MGKTHTANTMGPEKNHNVSSRPIVMRDVAPNKIFANISIAKAHSCLKSCWAIARNTGFNNCMPTKNTATVSKPSKPNAHEKKVTARTIERPASKSVAIEIRPSFATPASHV